MTTLACVSFCLVQPRKSRPIAFPGSGAKGKKLKYSALHIGEGEGVKRTVLPAKLPDS